MPGIVEPDDAGLLAYLQNPWLLLGWVLLVLVLLAVLAGIIVGGVWIIRRARPVHPAGAS
jgi:hypothetical protein